MNYWSISSKILIRVAEKKWYTVEILNKNKNLFFVDNGDTKILFKNIDAGLNSFLSGKVCGDKELAYDVLGYYGFPIISSEYLYKSTYCMDEFSQKRSLSFPLVVKPLDTNHGQWVITNIQTEKQLDEAINNAFVLSDSIVVQSYIEGDEHRIIVMDDELVLAINRTPPFVVGDGMKTVEELIAQENTSLDRGDWYDKGMSKIPIDLELKTYIDNQGYSLQDVLASDAQLQLRGNSNIGTGGSLHVVTEKVHPSITELCRDIAKTLNLKLVGIDIITSDISLPITETKGVILELGPTPGFWWAWEEIENMLAEKWLDTVFAYKK